MRCCPFASSDEGHFVFMATSGGTVKKTPLKAVLAAAGERHHRCRSCAATTNSSTSRSRTAKAEILLSCQFTAKPSGSMRPTFGPMGRGAAGVTGHQVAWRSRGDRTHDYSRRLDSHVRPKTASASVRRSMISRCKAAAGRASSRFRRRIETAGRSVHFRLMTEDEIMLISSNGHTGSHRRRGHLDHGSQYAGRTADPGCRSSQRLVGLWRVSSRLRATTTNNALFWCGESPVAIGCLRSRYLLSAFDVLKPYTIRGLKLSPALSKDSQRHVARFNFSAGPAALPLEVLEIIRNDIPDWQNTGMSVMEVSHRGKHFVELAARAEANVRELLGIPDDYSVLVSAGRSDTADGDGATEPDGSR